MDPIALSVNTAPAGPPLATPPGGAAQGAQGAPAQARPADPANPIVPAEATQASDDLLAGFQGILLPGMQQQQIPRSQNPLMGVPIGQLTDKQMDEVFGSRSDEARGVASVLPSLTAGDFLQLREDPTALGEIMELMELRPDLNVGDLMYRDSKGNLQINGAVRDANSRDLMVNRPDIKPVELTDMRASFAADLKQPALADVAYKSALQLLKTRSDVRPQDLSQLMTRILRGTGGSNDPGNAAAAVEIFKTGTKLMQTRTDIQPHDVARLSDTVAMMGGKQDGKSGMKIANAFAQAADFLVSKPGSNVGEVAELATTVRQRMPGESGDDTDARLGVFTTGLQMMKNVPGLGAAGIGTMLQKAAMGPPPRAGQDMINAFNTMGANMLNGRASMNLLTDRTQRPTDPRNQQQQAQGGEILLDAGGREVAPIQPIAGRDQQGDADGQGGQGQNDQGQNGQNGQGQNGQAEDLNNAPLVGPERTPIPRQFIPRNLRR
ncbi:MAG: hypothetical protein AMXMBFR33_61460 [Candidatus Xenobia bacterium]